MVFVNGRRINEYSLVQAIEYGSEGHFPNGGHPFAFLFVSIDPSLVDFNIHPAKREVRFRDAGELHKAVSSTTREFYRRYEVARIASSASGDLTLTQLFGGASSLPENAPHADEALPRYHATSALYDQAGFAQTAFARATFARATFARAALAPSATDNPSERGEPSPAEPSGPFRILGQTLGTFIAVERGGSLYLIDQHAAHERILYDELYERKGHRQELMVPYRVETDTEEENAALRERASELSAAGFSLEEEGTGTWLVTAVPERWKGTEDDLREGLVSARSGPEALLSRLFALAACRAAVKDGDVIDADAARIIVSKAFELREPVCPHGRPVWIRLSREDLYRAIKRT
jgi:DNA mismatch repair protein MutL